MELKIGDLNREGKEHRTDLILDKVKNKKPFEMMPPLDGKPLVLEFINLATKLLFENKNFDKNTGIGALTRNGEPLFKSGNKEFKLGQLFKSPADFGGGKGSGGGAADTAINESLQCFYASILFNTSETKLTSDNCSLKVLQDQLPCCYTQDGKSGPKYNTRAAVKTKLYEKAKAEWVDVDPDTKTNVYMRIANALYKSAPATPFIGKKVYFHRGSDFMDAIYAARKRAWDFDKTQETRITPLSGFSNDKWNPGDIWMSTLPPNPDQESSNPLCFHDEHKSKCQTFDDLKDHVLVAAKTGKFMGVSLKKVANSAKIAEFNTGTIISATKKTARHQKGRGQNVTVSYSGFVFGQTGNFFSSADCYLHFNAGQMQLRSTASTKSWQGEMKGTQASGGKIGGGGINYFCETILETSIGHGKNLQGVKTKGVGWTETTSVDKDNMYKLYKKYNKLQMPDFKNVTFKKGKGKDENGKLYDTDIVPIVKIKIDKPDPYIKLDKSQFRLIETDEKGYNKNFKQYIVKEKSITAGQGYVNRNDFDILCKEYINNKGQKSAPAFYFSKYMCLLFLDAMFSGKEDKTLFFTKIVRYAMSNIDISSYFIKIYS